MLTGNRLGWTVRCGRPPLLLSCRKLEFRLSALMDSDLAWVNGKSGRQSWRYADTFQRSIISEAIYHFTTSVAYAGWSASLLWSWMLCHVCICNPLTAWRVLFCMEHTTKKIGFQWSCWWYIFIVWLNRTTWGRSCGVHRSDQKQPMFSVDVCKTSKVWCFARAYLSG